MSSTSPASCFTSRTLPLILALAFTLILAACDGTLTPFKKRGESGRVYEPCEVPVPDHVTIEHEIWNISPVHFYVPHARWALATAHASSRLLHLQADGLKLPLSPSYFFSLALKESFLGCDDSTKADPVHSQYVYRRFDSTDQDGCFQITSVAWDEMCRMFPEQLDCSKLTHKAVISASDQKTTGHSNFELSAIVVTLLMTFGYAMITKNEISDANAWIAAAKDPYALEKLLSLIFNQGAWSEPVKNVLSGCQSKLLESCLSPGGSEEEYIKSVAAYTATLEASVKQKSCYNANISTTDVASYLDRIKAIFPKDDWLMLQTEAFNTFVNASGGATEAPFQQIAKPILEMLEKKMKTRLRCPDTQLKKWYQHSCP